jgi:hypothetical protein
MLIALAGMGVHTTEKRAAYAVVASSEIWAFLGLGMITLLDI